MGTLHQPDWLRDAVRKPVAPYEGTMRTSVGPDDPEYDRKVDDILIRNGRQYLITDVNQFGVERIFTIVPRLVLKSDHAPAFAMDFNAKVEELVRSPETLELDYTLGTRNYQPGEVIWTRNAEYVVEDLRNQTLYLVRKDVWYLRNRAKDETPDPMEDYPIDYP
jgi:hypothetical protein